MSMCSHLRTFSPMTVAHFVPRRPINKLYPCAGEQRRDEQGGPKKRPADKIPFKNLTNIFVRLKFSWLRSSNRMPTVVYDGQFQVNDRDFQRTLSNPKASPAVPLSMSLCARRRRLARRTEHYPIAIGRLIGPLSLPLLTRLATPLAISPNLMSLAIIARPLAVTTREIVRRAIVAARVVVALAHAITAR